MRTIPPISFRLAAGMLGFVVGLIVLGITVAVAVWLVRRRGRGPSDDYAVRLLHNSAVPFGIQIVVRAIDFAFIAILYRVLFNSPDSLANYEFTTLITTLLLATIAEWGLNIYLTREVARNPAAIERVFGTALLLRFGLAALVIPASLGIVWSYQGLRAAGVIAYGIDRQGMWLMLLFGATVLPGALSAAVTALFLATERPIVPAVVGLMTNIVATILKIAALLLGFGVIGVALGALGAALFSAICFGVLLMRAFGWPRLRYDSALARMMLGAGFPLMLNALLLAVFFRFDYTIIKGVRPPAELVAYGMAYKWVSLTQILPPIVINAIFPMFARQALDDRAALQRGYAYTIRLLLLLALPLATVVSLLAPWSMLLLSGSEGARYVTLGAPALTILIWYLPLSYVNGVTQYVLIALDRATTITISFALAAVFNFVFNLVFVPRFGITAAAVGTVLTEIVLYLPLWWVLRRQIAPTPIWRTIWRPALAALGMALGLGLLSRVHVLLAVIVAPLLFGGLLVAVGAVQEEDRRLARRVLRRA